MNLRLPSFQRGSPKTSSKWYPAKTYKNMRNWTNVDPGFTLVALGLYHFTDHFQSSIWSGAKWHFSHALIAALKLMLSGTTLGAVHGVHQLKHGWPFTLHVPEKRTTTLYICRVWHELQKSSCLGSETVIIINFAIYDSLCIYNMHEYSSWWFQRPEKNIASWSLPWFIVIGDQHPKSGRKRRTHISE